MRVLCVEDDPTMLELIQAVLASEGHEVLGAATGADAMRLLRGHELDLVIADIGLPDMSGAEVLRATRALAPAMPTVGISASMDPAIEAEALEAGVGRFLRKPFHIADLLGEVRLIASLRGRLRLLLAGSLAASRPVMNALRQEGFVVSSAGGAEAVISALHNQPIDILVAAAHDQLASAEQFLARRKTDRTMSNVPVIAVTEGQDDSLLRDGAALCLPAPLDAPTLAKVLHFMGPSLRAN